MNNDLYCKLFIDSSLSKDSLTETTADFLNLKLMENRMLQNQLLCIEIRRNKEFDKKRSKEFPDGFLYFPYYLEIDIVDRNQGSLYKQMIGQLLKQFWQQGYPCVAACHFEEELPFNGGYRHLL